MVIPVPRLRLAPVGALAASTPALWSVTSDGEARPVDERRAFEARMRSAWPGVVRLVERLLAWPGSTSEVEDVAQEAFLAAWRARRSFRGEAEWSTWVHTIALRHARNAGRSRDRRQRWFGRSTPALDEIAGADDRADDGVSRGVRDVLKRLRHADREVLVLRYLEDVEIDEIAARLGLERPAVDARLTRARARMRALLDPLDGEEASR